MSSQSRYVAGNLPEELLVEILVKVPARWVVGLRCVCKSWNSLIIDPQFALTHFDHHRNTKQILLIDFCKHLLRKSLSLFNPNDNEQPTHTFIDIHSRAPRRLDFFKNPNFADFFKDCVFSGSINGIICISPHWRLHHSWVALLNPVINHWKLIPLLPAKGGDSLDTSFSLAFDSITNDYKIIRLISLETHPLVKSRIEIYSANHDSWIEGTAIPFFTTQPNSSVIVKGVPYWSRNYKEPDRIFHCQSKYVIASVHPHTGLHTNIRYPAIVMDCRFQCNVIPFNLMDSLAVLIHSRDMKSNQMFHVYALDETSATWIKIYTTAPTFLQNQNIFIHRCFEDDGKTIIMGWNNDHRCSFLYDPKTDFLRHSIGVGISQPIWDESYHHVETMFSINGMGPIPKGDDNNQERGEPTYRGRELAPLFGAEFATFADTKGSFDLQRRFA